MREFIFCNGKNPGFLFGHMFEGESTVKDNTGAPVLSETILGVMQDISRIYEKRSGFLNRGHPVRWEYVKVPPRVSIPSVTGDPIKNLQ